MKIYILQKDAFGIKAGSEFKPVSALSYSYIDNPHFHIELEKDFVENNPEWFLLKKDYIEWVLSDWHLTSNGVELIIPSEIDGKLLKKIKVIRNDFKYTEEDMRKCFEEARLTNAVVGFKYNMFEDYLKSINK